MRIKWPSSEQLLFAANILLSRCAFKPRYDAEISSILIVKLDEIGDMATATNVFALLKRSYPKANIDVLCKPLLKNMIENDADLHRIMTDISEWRHTYDAVVELRGSFSSLMKSLRYRPKYRTSRALVRWQNRGKQLHEIDTNYAIVKPLIVDGIKNVEPKLYYSDSDLNFVQSYIKENKLQKIALLHISARKKLRQWNPERFALAAEHLHQKYSYDIVFIGSAEEKSDIDAVRSICKVKTFDGSGVFSLSQLACLCSLSSFYLGNESGPLQIASSFSLPLLALFGPGVPNVFYPRHPHSAILHHVLSCNPCDQIHCVNADNPCISRIQTAEVILKMDEILQK